MDIAYWEEYYKKNNFNCNNSLFSSCVSKYLEFSDASILELGCGNGRDAFYFEALGFSVVAIDQVVNELEFLSNEFGDKNIKFISGDFTQLGKISDIQGMHFDCIYSRFTLHSITTNDEKRLLSEVPRFLKEKGIFAIEARGKKNSLCGLGDKIEEDECSVAYRYNDHYRRFIDFDLLCKRLESDFDLIYAKEDLGFAPYNGEDDFFFRILARKK